MTPTAGTTPRPWRVIPADWEFHAHVGGPSGEPLLYADDGEPDLIFAVYAVNHIEAAETALGEALALLDKLANNVEAICNAYGDKGWAKSEFCQVLRSAIVPARAFLAAHAAPEEKRTACRCGGYRPTCGHGPAREQREEDAYQLGRAEASLDAEHAIGYREGTRAARRAALAAHAAPEEKGDA